MPDGKTTDPKAATEALFARLLAAERERLRRTVEPIYEELKRLEAPALTEKEARRLAAIDELADLERAALAFVNDPVEWAGDGPLFGSPKTRAFDAPGAEPLAAFLPVELLRGF